MYSLFQVFVQKCVNFIRHGMGTLDIVLRVDNINEMLKHFGFNQRKMQVGVNMKSNDF